MKRVGLIGCGAIGTVLAEHIINKLQKDLELTSICDSDNFKLKKICEKFQTNSFQSFSSYLDIIPNVDIVVESASGRISGDIAINVLKQGKEVIVLSVGGLLEKYKEIENIKTGMLYIPSGALAGIDAVYTGSLRDIYSVELITRKHPKGLMGTPYIIENNINLDNIGDDEFVLFEGTASDAVLGFPKNINVSALLSIVGLGKDKTKVKIITSTKYNTNTHEVVVSGSFGEIRTITNNKVCPENSKTSYLAALSACAVLSKMCSRIKIGT